VKKKAERSCILIILDGWGIGPAGMGNALHRAETPVIDGLMDAYPHTILQCAGEAVGLPAGVMGNSEVGHVNIGAGRVVYQDLLRINIEIREGRFKENPVFNRIISSVVESGSDLHLLGLVSDGGVHSHLDHLLCLLDLAGDRGLKRVYVHSILDGRDTSPTGGAGFLEQVQKHITRHKTGRIATVCGRYYAMDRDTRWERTSKAYRLYTQGKGTVAVDPVSAVVSAYKEGITDEFMRPIVLADDGKHPLTTMKTGDGIISFNFRADRIRQITRALTKADFDGFDRDVFPDLAGFVCMTVYDDSFDLPAAHTPIHLKKILGEVLSDYGLHQLRIAETEKYAHVTYFFSGGLETPFDGEDRCLIPSPRDVETYDQKPEMSAYQVTEEVISRLNSGRYDVIVLNFANMDMVGHTGNVTAAARACETVDRCLGEIVETVRSKGNAAIITADHGNAEQMDDGGNPHTAHTTHPVPFILIDDERRTASLRSGVLGDIAPTLLEVLGLDQPEEMTGRSLIQNGN